MKYRDVINKNAISIIVFFTQKIDEEISLTKDLNVIASFLDTKTTSITRIDIDKNKDLCNTLKIHAVPTTIIYRYGEFHIRWDKHKNPKAILNYIKTITL